MVTSTKGQGGKQENKVDRAKRLYSEKQADTIDAKERYRQILHRLHAMHWFQHKHQDTTSHDFDNGDSPASHTQTDDARWHDLDAGQQPLHADANDLQQLAQEREQAQREQELQQALEQERMLQLEQEREQAQREQELQQALEQERMLQLEQEREQAQREQELQQALAQDYFR